MDMSLYRKKLSAEKKKEKPKLVAFQSAAEEAAWTFGPDYDIRAEVITTPYGQYNFHKARYKSVGVGQPHGDFHSDYPYAVIRGLTNGVFYHEYGVQFAVGGPWTTYAYGKSGMVTSGRGQQTYKDAIDKIKSIAQIAIADKILKDRESWDVMVDLAELKATSGFVRDCGESLVGLIQGVLTRNPKLILKSFRLKLAGKDSVKHRKKVMAILNRYQIRRGVADTGQVMKAAADLWLSYRYGLMPLLYSADDAAVALSSPNISFAKAYQVTIPDSGKHYSRVSYSSGRPVNIKEEVTGFYNISCRLRAVVDYSEALASRLGQDPWTPVLVSYEILTLSFVLDWFLDIGGWLERKRLLNIIGTLSATRTVREKTIVVEKTSIEPRGYGYVAWRTSKILNEDRSVEERLFTRDRVTVTAPPPVLAWGLDKWKRQIDAIALSVNFLHSYHKGKTPL